MRILYVYEYYFPHIGGGELAIQQIAEGMVQRGHQAMLVTTRLPGSTPLEMVNGVKVIRVWTPTLARRYWFILLSVLRVYQLAAAADIIHTSTYTAAIPAWLAARLRGKKIILTIHEYWGELWKTLGMSWILALVHRWFERLIFCFSFDQYIAVSDFTRSRLVKLGIDEKKITAISHGIDQGLFIPQPADIKTAYKKKIGVIPETFTFLFFGRPGVSKGLEFLLQAVPTIQQLIPGSVLVLLLAHEPQAQYKKMQRLIQKLHISEHVRLLDPVAREELPKYLASANVVVVPSLSEGFGFSVAEACSVGVPVVASNVGSIPEVISGTCILVPPRDPQAIAEAVHNIFLGKGLHTSIKQFSWLDKVLQHEKLYLTLL